MQPPLSASRADASAHTATHRPADSVRWAATRATAATVRRLPDASAPRPRSPRLLPAVILAVAIAAAIGMSNGPRAAANGTADNDLFSLTNQDRGSNGVAALQGSGTLQAIAEGRPYGGCGYTVYGRSQDMINRNYFAHPILNCGGRNVFAMMQSSGVGYRSAGENIGWDANLSDPGVSAAYINGEFMNSSEHRSNILDGAYTHLGVGTAQTNGWSGGGGPCPCNNVWMFSEEFAQMGAPAPAPAPPPAPPPPPRPVGPAPLPPRNSEAPPPPALPPQTTEQPSIPTSVPIVPTPSAESASPAPLSTGSSAAPGSADTLVTPPIDTSGGLLSDSVEAVLEAYLVN